MGEGQFFPLGGPGGRGYRHPVNRRSFNDFALRADFTVKLDQFFSVNSIDSYFIDSFWQYLQGKKCADMGSYIIEWIVLKTLVFLGISCIDSFG